MPLVEFTESFSLYRQAFYNKGERAMVTDTEAQDICEQHAGFLVQSENDSCSAKMVASPPAHKQIKGAPVAK